MAINTTYTVYTHTDPYGKKYIGITKRNLEDRWKNGLGYATNKDMRFFDAIRTIGWDNFTHETVASGLTKLEAEKLESELIDKYNTTNPEYGYNIFNPKKKENGEIPNIDKIRQAVEDFREKGINIPVVVVDKNECEKSIHLTKLRKKTLVAVFISFCNSQFINLLHCNSL